MSNKNTKVYLTCKTTMFERNNHTVKDLATGKREVFKSINLAKKFCRNMVDQHGLGSVVVI